MMIEIDWREYMIIDRLENINGVLNEERNIDVIFYGDLYEDYRIVPEDKYIREIYESRGIGTCNKLNGSYIFILKDDDDFYIGTDSYSIIPLYYCYRNNELYYSYSLFNLMKVIPCPIKVNENRLLFGTRQGA